MRNNKDDKKDIGILGYWFATNYGGVASYYSLYRQLEKMGYAPFLVENPYLKTDKEGIDVFSRNFFKEMDIRIGEGYDIDSLGELNKLADTFILGSDQVMTTSSIRAFGKLFLMDFAKNETKRIAYSVSCGGDNLDADKEIVKYAGNLLKKFSHISVRENSAVDIFKKRFGLDVDLVIDPIFLTTADEFSHISSQPDIDDSNYLFAYILDPTPNKRQGINEIASELNLKKRVALDGRKYTYDKNYDLLNMKDVTLPQLDFPQWLGYFMNASFVFTDSFHGAAMAIIFNKPFIMYANHMRGYPRFVTLAKMFELQSRMVENSSEISGELVHTPINFDRINEIVKEKQSGASAWLKEALESSEKRITDEKFSGNTVKDRLNEKMCTGCSACVNICPKGALSLQPDEHGYFRSFIEYDKCIKCGLCSKICPALNLPENTNLDSPELYALIAADQQLLWNSSSGGAFSLLAEETFKRGGVVVGAAWRDDFSVEHIMIDTTEDLPKLQKSKYLQSYLGDIYSRTREKLEHGTFVLFSACPCQIAGLKAFLGKEYDNLITVDLLCSNSPSTMFFKKYIQEDYPNGLEKYEFRHKVKGWNADCTTTTTTINGVISVRRGEKQDNYQRVYHNHTMCPLHCENCIYQNLPRFGDITIGDFWGLKKKDSSIETEKGVSAVLCNNKKGKEFFLSISSEAVKLRRQTPLDWLGGNGFTIKGSRNYCSPKRDLFYESIKTMNFSEAVNYALKPNHGIYSKADMLDYRTSAVHFHFDSALWQENYINGATVLTTKMKYPKAGNYCTLPLAQPLKIEGKYVISIKFKLSTDSPIMNFHAKDSGSKIFQVIYSHKVTPENRNKWITIEKEFIPDCNFYDEFMIGAAQLNGEERYIAIEYVSINSID